MKLTTPMSCSRQARTIFSGSPALSAWVALCSRWAVEVNRNLKKSSNVGFSGIFGSRGSAPISMYLPGYFCRSAAPLSISTLPSARLNSTDFVLMRSWSCIICSSSASARYDSVIWLAACGPIAGSRARSGSPPRYCRLHVCQRDGRRASHQLRPWHDRRLDRAHRDRVVDRAADPRLVERIKRLHVEPGIFVTAAVEHVAAQRHIVAVETPRSEHVDVLGADAMPRGLDRAGVSELPHLHIGAAVAQKFDALRSGARMTGTIHHEVRPEPADDLAHLCD